MGSRQSGGDDAAGLTRPPIAGLLTPNLMDRPDVEIVDYR